MSKPSPTCHVRSQGRALFTEPRSLCGLQDRASDGAPTQPPAHHCFAGRPSPGRPGPLGRDPLTALDLCDVGNAKRLSADSRAALPGSEPSQPGASMRRAFLKKKSVLKDACGCVLCLP